VLNGGSFQASDACIDTSGELCEFLWGLFLVDSNAIVSDRKSESMACVNQAF
jgi:hypothetical protein